MTAVPTVFKRLIVLVPALALSAVAAAGCGGDAAARGGASPGQAMQQLERIVHARVDAKRSAAIVAGMVFPDGSTRVVAYGDAGGGKPVSASSVFEIGSITKVLTGTLLADAARRGEARLDDPVAGLLPASVTVPSRSGREITLEQLATHTSGLPREPTNGPSDDAGYSVADMYRFLSGHTLQNDPGGDHYEYSNLGVGLLGHALGLRARMGYEALVRERILAPLGMRDTAIAPTARMQRRLATGHDAFGDAVRAFTSPTLGGAGAERSTIGDMLRFAAANLEPSGDRLRTAMATARAAHTKHRVGLGWERGDRGIVWKDGGTNGFASFIGLDAARGTAVVVLSNSRAGINDMGLHMLDGSVPLAPGPNDRKAIALAPHVLDRYVGTYDLAGSTVKVTRSGRRLTGSVLGEGTARLYAQTATRFFMRDADLRVDFHRDSRGRATGALVHFDGQMLEAVRRLREVRLAPAVLERYVGVYEVAGDRTRITRSGQGLSARLPDGETYRLHAESPTGFFVREADAQVRFDVGAGGAVTGGVLEQAGRAIPAVKVG